MEIKQVKVIGLGGIGSIFINKLVRYVNHCEVGGNPLNWEITLIDGDDYEVKNFKRQEFIYIKNKAMSKFEELNNLSSGSIANAIPEFINENNVVESVRENDTIFLCVDNHKTRKIISEHARTLNDVIIVSGGNDETDGNVQIFIREHGKSLTPSLTDYHPEILNPVDKLPTEMSCEELANAEPQLFFANLTAATIMCWIAYKLVTLPLDKVGFCESYFDIVSMAVNSVKRQPRS